MQTFREFLIETNKFKQLQKNKVVLTAEEREECLNSKAVWNYQSDPVPAVWKSVNKNGKTTYITNTHRAYNTAPTLKGAIKRYHDFIKGTA